MPKRASIYNTKLVLSGDLIIEKYEYENSILQGFTSDNKGRSEEANEIDKLLNRKQAIQRTKQYVKRLINTNYTKGHMKLVTLTFKDNEQDIAYVSKELKKWVQRINRYLGYNIEYIAFRERQLGSRKEDKKGRGAIHLHIVIFNVPQYLNLTEFRSKWLHGSTNVKKDLEDMQDFGGYITSYMDLESEFFKGKKLYTSSKGLKKPIEIKENIPSNSLSQEHQGYKETYSNTYTINDKDGNFKNKVKYTQYRKVE